MSTILDEICAYKRHELKLIDSDERQQTIHNVENALTNGIYPHYSIVEALQKSSTGIIAEFKRKSPSLGWIKENLMPEDVVPQYAENGAAALSILTDERYFGGKLEFIRRMRPLVNIPILRKDFMVDEYQVFEAKNVGADVILLIAACLTKKECQQLAYRAMDLDMDVLLEVHEEKELEYICEGVSIVGINNRNLHIFNTDVKTSFELSSKIPEEYTKISESGLKSVDDLHLLRDAGFNGFLMGERFMKEDYPAKALGEFIKQLQKF